MEWPTIILAFLGVAGSAGAVTAYYRRGEGKETISLLKDNISAYQNAEKLMKERVAYLEGQVYSKDQTIRKLSEK